jgi:hypothetical protein
MQFSAPELRGLVSLLCFLIPGMKDPHSAFEFNFLDLGNACGFLLYKWKQYRVFSSVRKNASSGLIL